VGRRDREWYGTCIDQGRPSRKRNGKGEKMENHLIANMVANAPVITLAAIFGQAVVRAGLEGLRNILRIEKVGGMRFVHIKIGRCRKIVIMFCVSSKV